VFDTVGGLFVSIAQGRNLVDVSDLGYFSVAEINGLFDYPLHGSIRSRVGTRFLESHASWNIV